MAETTTEPATNGVSVNGNHDMDNKASPAPKDKNGKDPYRFPDAQTLQKAGEVKIKDENGTEIEFKSLYEGKSGRQLIIFIRHFYCGNCEAYVQTLTRELPPAKLAATTPPTTLTIIGCGDPVCIPDYRKRTMAELGDTPFALYAEPTRKLHSLLEMVSNLSSPKTAPGYLSKGILATVVSSTMTALGSNGKILKSGAKSQNGGEWLFQDGRLVWCHRMSNTGDHAEVKELKEALRM